MTGTLTNSQVRNEVANITNEAAQAGINVTECTELVTQLNETAIYVISNLTACINNGLKSPLSYSQIIFNLSQDVLGNVTAIKDEALNCGDKLFAFAVICTNKVS